MKFSRNVVTQTNHKPLFGSSLKGRISQSRGNSPDLRIDPPPNWRSLCSLLRPLAVLPGWSPMLTPSQRPYS